MSTFRMLAQTLHGLEEVLRQELLKLGARDIQRHNRAVSFSGDLGFLYKANLCLRTAIRVLVPVGSFGMRSASSPCTPARFALSTACTPTSRTSMPPCSPRWKTARRSTRMPRPS